MTRRSPTAASGPRRRRRACSAGAIALGLALAVTACGDDSSSVSDSAVVSTASDGSEFNQADVTFASQMIPHHAQAVEMVVMAQERDLSAPVLDLMDGVRSTQVPEIETMADWLSQWDEPIPETSIDHANAENGGIGDLSETDGMVGMMTPAQMADLDAAPDAEFEQLWLTMMRAHHTGAITMAETEVANGHDPEAIALAEEIIAGQTAELDLMETLG